MNDTGRVSELSSGAIGGMTEEIAPHLYEFLNRDDDAVARQALGAFEYRPRDDAEQDRIQYDRVLEAASRGDDPKPEAAQRIHDRLSFVVGEHADVDRLEGSTTADDSDDVREVARAAIHSIEWSLVSLGPTPRRNFSLRSLQVGSPVS